MLSLGKMSPHSPTLHNVSKTCKAWKFSANSTPNGATITSESGKAMSGKAHSKHEEDYLNQKSCSSECQIHQPVFNALSTTKLWNGSTRNSDLLVKDALKTTWTTLGLEPSSKISHCISKSSISYSTYLQNTAYT